jgi:hypothetical protein
VAPSEVPGQPDVAATASTPNAWAIEYRFVFVVRSRYGPPVIDRDDARGDDAALEGLGALTVRRARGRMRTSPARLDNLALIYPDDSHIRVAHARGPNVWLDPSFASAQMTGELLVAPCHLMAFQLNRDILLDTDNTVAHEMGHCFGLADTPNHRGPRLMGHHPNGRLLDEDKHWLHRAADAHMFEESPLWRTSGTQVPYEFDRDL